MKVKLLKALYQFGCEMKAFDCFHSRKDADKSLQCLLLRSQQFIMRGQLIKHDTPTRCCVNLQRLQQDGSELRQHIGHSLGEKGTFSELTIPLERYLGLQLVDDVI